MSERSQRDGRCGRVAVLVVLRQIVDGSIDPTEKYLKPVKHLYSYLIML